MFFISFTPVLFKLKKHHVRSCRKAIVPAAVAIAALGLVSAYTFVLIGRSCAETKADSYEQSWARTVGQKTAWLPAGACIATCFAGCLAFTIIIGDSFASLAETFGAPALVANRSNIIMAVSAAVLLPLSLLKSAFTSFFIVFDFCHLFFLAGGRTDGRTDGVCCC